MTLLRYTIPDLPSADELLPYLRRIDDARWYSNFGPLVDEFEQRLVLLLTQNDAHPDFGSISLATMVSGHHALIVGLRLLNLPKQATVLVPSVTFPSCPLAIMEAGATPLFSDIDPETWCLTPTLAREIAARRRIDAVMPVAVYGVPVEGWDEFTRDTGIPVIIDAAAALESQPVPARGFVAYSMHATKPFGIGEGGLLATRDPLLVDAARQMSNFGTVNRLAVDMGTNAKLSEYHAAVGLAQLDRWEGIKHRRRKVFEVYLKILTQYGLAEGLQKNIGASIVGLLMLKLNKPEAASTVDALNEKGIAAHRCYWPPLPHHPNFAKTQKAGKLPNAEALNRTIIGLPFHNFMNEDDIAKTVRAVAITPP